MLFSVGWASTVSDAIHDLTVMPYDSLRQLRFGVFRDNLQHEHIRALDGGVAIGWAIRGSSRGFAGGQDLHSHPIFCDGLDWLSCRQPEAKGFKKIGERRNRAIIAAC